jgi:hypothetical protein
MRSGAFGVRRALGTRHPFRRKSEARRLNVRKALAAILIGGAVLAST